MNKFRPYNPAFVDGPSHELVDFDSTQGLTEIPYFKRYVACPGFFRFSLDASLTVMAEFDLGYRWYVIGSVSQPIDLPKFEPRKIVNPPKPTQSITIDGIDCTAPFLDRCALRWTANPDGEPIPVLYLDGKRVVKPWRATLDVSMPEDLRGSSS